MPGACDDVEWLFCGVRLFSIPFPHTFFMKGKTNKTRALIDLLPAFATYFFWYFLTNQPCIRIRDAVGKIGTPSHLGIV